MKSDDVLDLLNNDRFAQELLRSNIPARLAYIALDGTPRVVPVGFHWNGETFVVASAVGSAKRQSLAANPHVAITIDTNELPPRVLLVRGTASLTIVNGVPDEYLLASNKRISPDQQPGFEAQVRAMYDQMVRIEIVPTWAKVHDFETRIPSAEQRLAEEKFGAGQ